MDLTTDWDLRGNLSDVTGGVGGTASLKLQEVNLSIGDGLSGIEMTTFLFCSMSASIKFAARGWVHVDADGICFLCRHLA